MAFGHPSQQAHMMAGVAKAAKSAKTPSHLRKHLQNRLAGMVAAPAQQSGPGNEELMEAAQRTPGSADPDQSEEPMEESLGQQEIAPKRSVSPMLGQLGSPAPVLTNAVAGAKPKAKKKAKASAFFGDFGGKPKQFKG